MCATRNVMIETKRLILRQFMLRDLEALKILLGDNEVMESSVDGPLDSAQIEAWLSEQFAGYKNGDGIEVLAVVNKSTTELIGYCGLFRFSDIDGANEIEVGYRLIRSAWGRGFATEAAIAIRDYAFSDLNLPRLIALIEPVNSRSIRVAEKLGMAYEKDVMLEDYDYPDHLYSIGNNAEDL
ncbi:MAG: GNAT family N-acetyltransferase [Pseudomonadota bacterium]